MDELSDASEDDEGVDDRPLPAPKRLRVLPNLSTDTVFGVVVVVVVVVLVIVDGAAST